MQLRRLALSTVAAVAVSASLAACGGDNPTVARSEGVYVSTGGLKYQVQISRQLTPADFEDGNYLKGIATGDANLPTDQSWFGVFIRVFNQSGQAHQSANRFVIEDTTGARFDPVRVDPNINVTAYRPLVVKAGDQIPVPGSLARENATQGGLVLFKIPVKTYANRPLELHIASPTGGQEAIVDLDI
jgi:hypothetical protein